MAHRLADVRPQRRRLDAAGYDRPRARVRGAGQRTAVSRILSLAIRAPEATPRISFEVRSNVARWHEDQANTGTLVGSIRLCVPSTGYAEARITTPLAAQTYGDMRDASSFGIERRLGVFLSSIALADEIGGRCRP